jgi:hypothetical protein
MHVCLMHPPAMSVTLSHAGISLGACHIVHSASKRSSGSRTCSVVEMIVMVIVVAESAAEHIQCTRACATLDFHGTAGLTRRSYTVRSCASPEQSVTLRRHIPCTNTQLAIPRTD